MIPIIMLNEIFNIIGMTSRKQKLSANIMIWLYFHARLYTKFGMNNLFWG